MSQKYFGTLPPIMTSIKKMDDIRQSGSNGPRLHLPVMIFSKSFGYSLRSVLYVAASGANNHRVPLSEVAEKLNIPRHFLGKVMKRLVKEGILSSQKGPSGGFRINERTLNTSLFTFVSITRETGQFDSCVLRLEKCNARQPCPLHRQAEWLKQQWRNLLSSTTVHDLLDKEHPDFIKTITSA